MFRSLAAFLIVSTLCARQARGQGAPVQDPPVETAYLDTLRLARDGLVLLRPYVVPHSLELLSDGIPIDSTRYRVEYRVGRIWLSESLTDSARVLVARYRAQPFAFKEVYRSHTIGSSATLDSASADSDGGPEQGPHTPFDPFAGSHLQRRGSITRGILAGNRRDVSVESGLRMEVSGELIDGVQIQAALTDENTPIQPEGTTQRLSEFDRVSIQLMAKYGTARLGDFDLRLQDNEFARFNRKLQGVSLTANMPAMSGSPFAGGQATVSAATSRGQYRMQEIQPIDGVQGPYRLEGNSGEQFIIVLAGSETVYVDGQRVERGETNDYTIDYQTGEITFTPRRIITDALRIAVEFQYTTYEFTRTLLSVASETNWWAGKDGRSRARLGVSFLREADSRQFGAELGLTPADSLLLVNSGDDLALRSGAEPVLGPFDPEAPYVQYVREARPTGTGVDSVYVPLRSAPEDGRQIYRVRFSRKGEGLGSYVRGDSLINGIQYEYVGEGRGDYEPVRQLPKPEQHDLIDFSGSIEPIANLEVFGEWAGSLYDQNRLSNLDSGDDHGRAYSLGLRLKPTAIPSIGKLSAHFEQRTVGDQFQAFDRFRPVEFARQWNLVSRSGQAGGLRQLEGEAVRAAGATLDFAANSHVAGEWGRIALARGFDGARRSIEFQSAEAGLPQLNYHAEYIQSADTLLAEDGSWLRQSGSVQYGLFGEHLVPRFEIEQERRKQFAMGTDSLGRGSQAFFAARPGIAWTTERLEAGGDVEVRWEQGWADGSLKDAGKEITLSSHFKYNPSRTFNTDANVGVRLRRFNENFIGRDGREDTQSLLLSWNARATPLNRAIQANWYYQAMSERTPLLQEIYLHTRPDVGQYVWEDASGDGVIQVDEFVPERTPDEGTYIKTFIPSDSLIAVTGVQAKLRVGFEPSRLWEKPTTPLQRALSNVSTHTTFEVTEKSRDEHLTQIYLLNLSRFLDPATTMNGRIRFAQEVYLFRTQPRYGLDFAFDRSQGLTELSSGEESRLIQTWNLEGRLRPTDRWGFKLRATLDRNRTFSEQYASRRYDIHGTSLHPEAAFSPWQGMQILGGPVFSWKRDALGDRTVRMVQLPVELRYTRIQRWQITSRLEMAQVALSNDAVGMALYELTEGRGAGRSFLINANAQYTINSYLRASLTYDGRMPSGAPPLHMFKLQLSASF
ncbi:MAG TPA: hypothetical protein VFG50_04285 [Rhodothermales bacterium]|nr:hypothetical protein [Rhodothermales bacterium]